MDFGMPTLIELNKLEDCAVLCKELGLQFIELNMNLPQYQINRIDTDKFLKIAEKYGIYYTIHLDENLNVSDFNSDVANAYTKTVLETIELSKDLGVPVLNMHLSKGVYFTLPDRKVFLFSEYKEHYLKSIKSFINVCETALKDSSIKISIENTDGFKDFHIEALELFMKSPVFTLTFDIGHDYCIGQSDEKIILNYGEKLYHMHLHDANSNGKNHLTLGTGEIDLQKYLNLARNNNCRVVLETKTIDALKKSVDWLERNQSNA
ncbi:MAG: sugar phosphate isomerase/epimerase [Oscillospiraceae bacterium]|nr:sugar phosphate isomerase/epimerase [Oscillospiraceae bacterium]